MTSQSPLRGKGGGATSFYAVFVSARMLLLGQFDSLLSNLRVSRLTRRPSTITSCFLPPTARDGSSSDRKDGRRHEAFFCRRPCLDNKLPRTPGKATHPPAAGCSRQGVRRVARPPVAVSTQERRDYAYKRGAAARGSPPKAFQVRRSSAKGKKNHHRFREEMCQLVAASQLITSGDRKCGDLALSGF